MEPLRRRLPTILATAVSIAALSLILSGTGIAGAARRAVSHLVDGHPLVTRPRAGGLLVLGRDGKFPRAAIPTLRTVPSAVSAKTAKTATNAQAIGGKTLAQVTAGCPSGTTDIGTWCLMTNPYPVAAAQQGQNNYFWATQACEKIGGFLPDAGELIGAAPLVKLESVINDNPATATVQGSDGTGPELDQREMSATLVTTQAGSDAAGSEGVTPGAHYDPSSGEPDPTPEPAVPSPSTLQYVTVYSNFTNGGFAGSEPVGAAENFRCAFDLEQGVSNGATSTTTTSTTSATSTTTKSTLSTTSSISPAQTMRERRTAVLARSMRAGQRAQALAEQALAFARRALAARQARARR